MSTSNRKPRFRKVGRGSVLVISTLLVSSAILRLASGVALAEDTKITARPLPEKLTDNIATQTISAKATTRAPLDRVSMAGLLENLQQREALLIERERQMALRTKALNVADEEISRRMVDLEKAEISLRKTLSLADGAAEEDLARLTTVYESMKPKDTAALFQTMEPDFAAGFLGRMRPDVAAAVMTNLPPEVAYSISVIMAGRNANVPKT